MRSQPSRKRSVHQPQRVPPLPPEALAELASAFLLKGDREEEHWQLAVAIDDLRQAGLTKTLLRWLVREGHVEHALEITRSRMKRRVFRPLAYGRFAEESCFILTARGYALAEQLSFQADGSAGGAPEVGREVPHWKKERRQLWFRGQLVKAFHGPATAQEPVVAAFQEDSWAARIDNPLPPKGNRTGKERLHDAVYRLNRHQTTPLLRFLADGTGEGICWEPL